MTVTAKVTPAQRKAAQGACKELGYQFDAAVNGPSEALHGGKLSRYNRVLKYHLIPGSREKDTANFKAGRAKAAETLGPEGSKESSRRAHEKIEAQKASDPEYAERLDGIRKAAGAAAAATKAKNKADAAKAAKKASKAAKTQPE